LVNDTWWFITTVIGASEEKPGHTATGHLPTITPDSVVALAVRVPFPVHVHILHAGLDAV
jgi:hypothetical protein